MKRFFNLVLLSFLLLISLQHPVFSQAEDPEQVVSQNADKIITILKGPVSKLLAAIILLAGVAGLLRGRHKIALSCGVAFVVLLFLPIILQQVAGH